MPTVSGKAPSPIGHFPHSELHADVTLGAGSPEATSKGLASGEERLVKYALGDSDTYRENYQSGTVLYGNLTNSRSGGR